MSLTKRFIPEISILLLALITRLIHLNGSFWLDEAAQALESARNLSEQLNISYDFQPPLFHLLVHGLIQINHSEVWLRLASLIPGLATVWILMAIGKRLFNREVGLTAGVLLATSQFHLFYSQELRPYSLATCLALIAFWGWLDLVISKKRFSPLFFFASLAGLYTMYLFPVFLLSLFVLTFIFYRSRTALTACHLLLTALLFLPWLPKFMEQTQIGTGLAQAQPVWSTMVSPPLIKMAPLVFMKFLLGRIAIDPIPSTIFISLGLLAVCLIYGLKTQSLVHGRIVNITAILPIFFALVISILVPVLDPKRVMFCLPFVYLSLSAGLSKSYRSAIALVFLLIVNLSAITNYAVNPDNQREPWREAIAQIEANEPPALQRTAGSPTNRPLFIEPPVVIFIFDAPFAPWVWYQHRNLETLALTDPKALPTLSTNSVILFDYLKPLYDPNNQLPLLLQEQGFSLSGYHQYPGIGKINLYAR